MWFPLIVQAGVVALMVCSDSFHDLFDTYFWLFESISVVAVFIHVGAAVFLFRRDKTLAVDCLIVSITVITLLILGRPTHAPPFHLFQ